MARATIYIDNAIWIPFRQACLAKHTSATRVVSRLIAEELARWEQEDQHGQTPAPVRAEDPRL